MTEAVIVGLLSVAGTVVTALFTNKVMLYRIEQLEKKVEKHNTLIERMYKVEGQINAIEAQLTDRR